MLTLTSVRWTRCSLGDYAVLRLRLRWDWRSGVGNQDGGGSYHVRAASENETDHHVMDTSKKVIKSRQQLI